MWLTAYSALTRASDLAPGSMISEEIAGRRIAIFNLHGEFFATDDTCTHAWASLSEGQMISGDEIICPLHFATFNIKTGQCTGGPAIDDLKTYAVRQIGDEIQIEV